MIVTCKKQIPFRWMLIALLPWSALTISQQVTGNAVIFSLKKFLDNPATLTFVLTLPSFLSLITVTLTNFYSDRIWTRFGRRKPFVGVGFAGMALAFFLMPLMPGFWSLVATYILLVVFMDLSSPIEPLKQEIVPPQQRGGATGVMFWINQAAQLLFMFFIFGRFDDVHFMGGIPISGETAIYWSAGLISLTMLFLITLGIKETRQRSSLTGEKLSWKTLVGGLADRELLPVYILIFGSAVLWAGTGPLGALLATEQWGYSKQELGTNIAVGGTLNLVLIALMATFADKLNRLKAYQTLILLSISLNIAYYCYVHFVLPDQRPTLFEMILFGEMMSIVGILSGLVYYPLIYDYVVRNKMGTYAAGAQLVTRLTGIITVNGAGLFIVGYAALFQPPAGEMARVVLQTPSDTSSLKTRLAGVPDAVQSSAQSSLTALHLVVWNADGTVESIGRGMEVRRKNPDSESLAANKQQLTQQLTPLLDRRKRILEQMNNAATSTPPADTKNLEQEIQELSSKIGSIDAELDSRAKSFDGDITKAIGNLLYPEGQQILSAAPISILVATLPVAKIPSRQGLTRLQLNARSTMPDLIDVVYLPGQMQIEISWVEQPGEIKDESVSETMRRFSAVASDSYPGLLLGTQVDSSRTAVGAFLSLDLVEKAVPTRISPITGFIRNVQALLSAAPPKDARLIAAAKLLHQVGQTPHVSVRDVPGHPNAVAITMMVEPGASPMAGTDAVTLRLKSLLAGGPADGKEDIFRGLYERVKLALAKQRLTVCEPLLHCAYAPVKYDYMAGNLLVIIFSMLGFGITMIFYHLNKTGVIRKLGVEEAQATE